MTHTFLAQPGRWLLEGHITEPNKLPTPISGRTLIGWSEDGFWFTMVSQVVFSQGEDYTLTYKGRFLTNHTQIVCTLEHPALGKMNGSGWLTPDVIVQYFHGADGKHWGIENLYRQTIDRYHFSQLMMEGQTITRLMSGSLTSYPV